MAFASKRSSDRATALARVSNDVLLVCTNCTLGHRALGDGPTHHHHHALTFLNACKGGLVVVDA